MLGIIPELQNNAPPAYYNPAKNKQPVKKLVTAYNEQILRRQHNSAYATVCQVVTSNPPQEPIYVNIYAA